MSELVEWIHNRIHKQNKNFLCAIVGETGSGKSYSALRMAETLDPSFNISRCCFSPDEFISLLNSGTLKRGDFIVLDEAGISMPSREFMSFTNKAMSYILQSFRHENLGVIFTLPDLSMLDIQARKLLHCLIETDKIIPEQNEVLVKVFFITNNPRFGKIYAKYPRFCDEAGKIYKIDGIYIPKPSERLTADYEAKKHLFTASLKQDLEATLKKIRQKQTKRTPQDYLEYVLKDAEPRLNEFITIQRSNKRRFIDKHKLKLAYPELSLRQLPLVQHVLSKSLHKQHAQATQNASS